MDIQPTFKRKHFGTPQSTLLIITNYVVFAVIISFANGKTGWFFWIAIGLLALYNFFNIRKDRDSYNKPRIIAYIVSVAILIGFFFLFKYKGYTG
jgi:hypothetical protein